MRSAATTVSDYLESLPPDRRSALEAVRRTILDHLPKGYEESMEGGLIAYQVPLAVYPDTYNKRPLMYAALASQKNHMAAYLCNAYAVAELRQRLEAGFQAAGKKLDMGKSCLRFKKIEDVELRVIGEIIAATPMDRYIEFDRGVHSKEARAARNA